MLLYGSILLLAAVGKQGEVIMTALHHSGKTEEAASVHLGGLGVWYGFVTSHPFLVHFFSDQATGQPEGHCLAAVRKRFGQWILDTAKATYGQAWLDYQYEIGLRHHRGGKNRTDGVNSVDHVSYRYLPALLYPFTSTLKPFFARKGHSAEQVDKMYQAWLKSVLLQVILWSQPSIQDGEF